MCPVINAITIINSDVKIGFAQDEYTYSEPDVDTLFRDITLIKEGGRVSERTFSVGISITEPYNIAIRAASIPSDDRSSDFSFGTDDQNFFNVTFPPGLQEVSLNMTLHSDNLPELVEGFQVSCTPVEGFPIFKFPETMAVHRSARVEITDNVDCKYREQHYFSHKRL